VASSPIVIASDLVAYQGGDAQNLIDQATALVRRYCGWHVTPSLSETVILDGSGNGIQLLPTMHLSAVTSVTYDGVLLTDEDYSWSPVGVIEYAPSGPYFSTAVRWATGLGKVVVVMTHGFDEAPDLAGVIMAIASRAQASPNGVTRSQMGPFSESFSQTGANIAGGVSMVKHEEGILDRYRLHPRP